MSVHFGCWSLFDKIAGSKKVTDSEFYIFCDYFVLHASEPGGKMMTR